MLLNYGEALKYQRETHNLNQSQLARATNIKQQNISAWENNTFAPSIDFCVQLADFYGITLDELVGRDHGREPAEAKYHIGTLNNSGKIDMK